MGHKCPAFHKGFTEEEQWTASRERGFVYIKTTLQEANKMTAFSHIYEGTHCATQLSYAPQSCTVTNKAETSALY